MTKAEIVKQIARETGVEAVAVTAVVEEFMKQVRGALATKENVYLRGFGTFLIKHRKAKTAPNRCPARNGQASCCYGKTYRIPVPARKQGYQCRHRKLSM